MKLEEIDQHPELRNEIVREIEEKAQKSHDLLSAEIEVLKAHGIEFDEDALKAEAVEKMQLNEENLEQVAGGYDRWCWGNYACHYIYKHPDKHEGGTYNPQEACYLDYNCIALLH